MKSKNKSLAKSVRWYRKWHRYIAMSLLVFIAIISLSGILLAWKDELQLKPPSEKSANTNLELLPLSKIETIAVNHIKDTNLDTTINRIDYRPRKGIAKVRFETHFTELQIDCYTGKILSEKTRTADIIEMIHEGSIVDFLFNSESKSVKLIYSSLIGFGLLFLSFSGFWLWKKPKQIKKNKF
ncbi:PepSY-associated TM helix domain-containing protein [Winogradskyella sp. SYSU M77433]|uniref:PepSY-associated TM helix domain-containing protein n=1 Tax=Winogradskyella sp. SYSU M77433 TaxID=3042722 RepID=UPI0024812ED5|nr:PepSY-associated TM helix domain-containing protein [Winogradskyella sp. SYSU M77433]MDH7914129.1 PepSY-associated TM helix domain-containing protein [Winogradskyella sp. SYSU M77433]